MPQEKLNKQEIQDMDLYVIVAENDQGIKHLLSDDIFFDSGGPLIFEQYTKSADLESIKKRAEYLGGIYGKCRIAKLQFLDIKG